MILFPPHPMAHRVLVIENVASPTSVEVAEHYSKLRGVKQILKVTCQDSALETAKETMAYADFKEQIETPLLAYLKVHHDIDFIVLTKGVPIRLTGASTGVNNTQPSLDSFIAAEGYAERKDVVPVQLNDSGFTGKGWANRFWNSSVRFTHKRFGGYLVTRLDGYTSDDARGLTIFAMQAEKTPPTGAFLLDTVLAHGLTDVTKQPLSPIKDGMLDYKVISEMAYNEYDTDMVACSMRLEKRHIPFVLDKTDDFIGHKSDLMGYCSWGSNDPHFNITSYKSLRFANGAIGETAVSTSARTFLPTSGGQSLIADLIANHITGVKGYCDEPLLQAVASPTVLFDRYTSGWTLAESFYAASRFIGWEDIVIGDPLAAPYAKHH